ncbi:MULTISPECIES: PP2C family protein-serine/threonine phosphatase [unclassified Thioalkalivibrio]|uniref:PP2C family protein-serine/threonine phosphatase n=1 Tax=unclassified Thioalkalivibrio TaxID=2621013 RepID=UPI00035EA147|nr:MULTISPECIES: SpoIIE family protein phosphatase [unclassified Thioalkalivibrio]
MTESGPARSRSLVAKLALATLLVALALSLLASAYVIAADSRAFHAETLEQIDRLQRLVAPPAAEAAYQLNADQAESLVAGLQAFDEIHRAEILDDFGRTLAEVEREGGGASWLGERLFGADRQHERELLHPDLRETNGAVGTLRVELAPDVLAAALVERLRNSVITSVVQALIVSLVVVLLFYGLMLRPMLRISRAVAGTDPDRPAQWPRPEMGHHANDELGALDRSLDRLLHAFQQGLDARDGARGELKALNEDLERRVVERTRELEAEKQETERALARVDEANRELERSNRLVVESIRYARRIQTAMLPDKHALDGHLDEVQVYWEPLHLVGGDYFWLEAIDGRSVLVAADCTGHGVPGAFITLVLASALDRILHEHRLLEPSAILREMDRLVRSRLRQDGQDSDSDDGLEAAVCVYDPDGRTLNFAGVGLPLIIDRGGEVEEIRGVRGGLGYRSLEPAQPVDHVVSVEPGMEFFLITDGAHDHVGGEPPRLFGRRRLRQVLAEKSPRDLSAKIDSVVRVLEDYRGGEPRRDDMTLVAFRPLPPNAQSVLREATAD